MENHTDLYLNGTQNYLIDSLAQQINLLAPIRNSYSNLQHYQVKVSHDLQSVLIEYKEISQLQIQTLQNQNILLNQLQDDKLVLTKQLQMIENEKAKTVMDKKNLLSRTQSLTTKLQLQKFKERQLADRAKQLNQQTKKNMTNSKFLSNINNELQLSIKQKSRQFNSLQNQLNQRQSLNENIQKNKLRLQNSIQQRSNENRALGIKNKQLQSQINNLQHKIGKQNKKNWDDSQNSIQKGQEIQKLNNQKQYYIKMLLGEQACYNKLKDDQYKFNIAVDTRTNDLGMIQKQNNELSEMIKKEKQRYFNSNKSTQSLNNYFLALIDANKLLLDQMEKWYVQDQKIINVIESKSDKLYSAIRRSKGVFLQKSINIYADRPLNKSSEKNTYLYNSYVSNTNNNNKQSIQQQLARTSKNWMSTGLSWNQSIMKENC